MLKKQISDLDSKNTLEWINNKRGLHFDLYCKYNDTNNYITITDIDSLVELRRDIEEQIDFRLSLLKKEK